MIYMPSIYHFLLTTGRLLLSTCFVICQHSPAATLLIDTTMYFFHAIAPFVIFVLFGD